MKKLAAFDLDHTLLSVNCSYLFCRYLYRRKILPFSSILFSILYSFRHRFLGLELRELHEKVFNRVLIGKSITSIASHADTFIKDELASLLYLPALQALRREQHLGHYTMILSNSPSFLVEAVARFLQVDAWEATHYAVDKDQKLCNISSIMQGEEKANCILQLLKRFGIEKSEVTAYSDSFLDLPFLLAAGTAVAVNPDRKLKRFSRKRQWKII